MLKEYLSWFSLNEAVTRSNGFKMQLGKSVIIIGQHLQSSMANAKLINLLSGIQGKIVQVFRGDEKMPFQPFFSTAPSTN